MKITNNNNNNNIEFVDSISRSGSSSAITSVISLYKVNEFTVTENEDPSYTNLGFDAPIQAVKPNKAIYEIVTPIEELRPTINTDMNKYMDIEMSRLRHENNLLQRNVNVLRDENVLLRDASEVLIIEFEKRVKPIMYGIRLKKSTQKRKSTHNLKNIFHPFILSPIQRVKNGKTI